MKKVYLSEVKSEMSRCRVKNEVFTEKEISALPAPLQRYFWYSGYIGKNKASIVKILYKDTSMRLGTKKPWIKIKYEQYNFVREPARIAFIDTRMMGIIPFYGRDKYQDGRGAMTGKLLWKVMFDVTGDVMDISALVTFLSEVLILPACVFEDYIRWEEIDENHVKAIIEYTGVKNEGIFTFSEKGEFISFVTDNRYMDKGDGTFEKRTWVAEASDYNEKNGVRYPTKLKATWKLPDGDFMYFNGSVKDVIYDAK